MNGQLKDAIMLVYTSRFGQVQVADDRVITFPKGILGFPRFHQYVLLQPKADSPFYWLQSTEAPDLAFVVTDPSQFVPTYRVAVRREQMDEMSLDDLADAQVLVIVNKHGDLLTGNLQGPLVVNAATRTGEQLVLSDRRYHTRVPLVEVGEPLAVAASA